MLNIQINGKNRLQTDADEDSSNTLSWILRCFLSSIRDAYHPGAPRSVEADSVVQDILEQVRGQMPADKYAEFAADVSKYLEYNYHS